MLFGRGAPWKVDTSSSLVYPNAWISQIGLSHLLVIEEQLQGCFQPPKQPTLVCKSVVQGRQQSLPFWGQDFQIRQEFPTFLKLREKYGYDYDLHLYVACPIVVIMNDSRGAVGWLGGVETEPQGTELCSRAGCTVRAMAGGHCSGVASQHHPYSMHLCFKILD